MKLCAAALAAMLLLTSPLAHADNGWYLAFDYGQAKASQPTLFSAESFSYNSGGTSYGGGFAGPVTHDQTSAAHRFALGYWFNSYVGFEASQADLGEHVTHAQFTSIPFAVSCGLPCENSYDNSPRLTADGKGLTITLGFPLPHSLKLVGRYGRFMDHVEYYSGMTPNNHPPYGNANPPPNYHHDSDSVVSTYGFGLRWEFIEHWAVRADWDNYKNLSGGSTTFDVRIVSAGIEYRF